MNFLAHAFLSGDDPDILAGNFMADFFKGPDLKKIDPKLSQGVLLHRKIDLFTDSHALVRQARSIFSPEIRHYSSVVVDIIFDHFMAAGWRRYSVESLEVFITRVYAALDRYQSLFPQRFRPVFDRMKSDNWLLGYRERNGIYQAIRGLEYRSAEFNAADLTFGILEENYEPLEGCFHDFFPELAEHVQSRLLSD
jgi:acyl carrier protein phosphodiesterase